jgi:hypothetical protein
MSASPTYTDYQLNIQARQLIRLHTKEWSFRVFFSMDLFSFDLVVSLQEKVIKSLSMANSIQVVIKCNTRHNYQVQTRLSLIYTASTLGNGAAGQGWNTPFVTLQQFHILDRMQRYHVHYSSPLVIIMRLWKAFRTMEVVSISAPGIERYTLIPRAALYSGKADSLVIAFCARAPLVRS